VAGNRGRLADLALPLTAGALFTLLLLGVGFTYYASEALLREKITEINQTTVSEVVRRFDTTLTIVDHLLVAALTDPDVRELMSGEYSNRAQRLLASSNIQVRLSAIRRSVPVIHSILLVSFRQNLILTDVIGTPLDQASDPKLAVLVRAVGIDGEISDPYPNPARHWTDEMTEDVILMIRPYPLGSRGNNATGGVIAVMRVPAIQEELGRFAREVGLSLSARSRSGAPIVNASAPSGASRPGWVSEPVRSSRTGWVFDATVSVPRTEIGIIRLRRIVVMVTLSGLVIAGITALVLDRRLRKPWQDAVLALAAEVEARTSPSATPPAAWDPDAIRDRISNALHRGTELEWHYEASRSAVIWQAVTRYLLSPHRPNPGSDALLEQIGLPGPIYQVLLVMTEDEPPSAYSRAQVALGEAGSESADGGIEAILNRGLGKNAANRSIRLPDGMIAVVISIDSHGKSVDRRCGALLSAVRQKSQRNVVAALGAEHEGPGGIHTSYVEATFALEFAVVQPDAAMLLYRDVAGQGAAIVPRRCADLLVRLPDLMRSRDSTRLAEWGRDFIAAVERDAINPVAVKHSVARFISDAVDAASRFGIETNAGERDFHHAVWAARSRVEIERVFHESVAFFDQAIRTAPVRRASEERGQQLVRFVDNSLYRHDLSLTLAADQIGASSAHTSRLFRETAGIPFQDYVAQHRVERARDLLRTTHRTVQEIGSDVGYGEVHSFIRTFRKRTGTTPAEYRRTAVASTSSQGASGEHRHGGAAS
jgi:AraC-like DNA-binding protein